MANRLAWWPAEKLLMLADSHFGKAATFRKAGLPVPIGTTGRMLEVLSDALSALQPSRLMVLGDFVHSMTPADRDFERELFDWRLTHSSLPITLVLGNHDRNRHRLFKELRLDVCNREICGPFWFCHDPTEPTDQSAPSFRVGGHIHPGVRLSDDLQRVPCFWQSRDCLVFPAFGAFTGLAKISARAEDVLFPVFDNQIFRVKAKDLGKRAMLTRAEPNDSAV